VAPHAIGSGLRTVRWPGRFEILSRQPFLVLDGAHNVESARRLMETVREYLPGRRVILVFGVSSDKDVPGMLRELVSSGVEIGHVLSTQAAHPRAEDIESVMEMLQQYNIPAEPAPSVGHALSRAFRLALPEDVILVTGSLFVVAEARAAHQDAMPA
jgi:dihydrofolate synthase/folylpolyglutamate synthase